MSDTSVTQTLSGIYPVYPALAPLDGVAGFLASSGVVPYAEVIAALAQTRQNRSDIGEVLVASGKIDPMIMAEIWAAHLGTARVLLDETPPDPALDALLDPQFCLKHAIVPYTRDGDTLVIATARPGGWGPLVDRLSPDLGPLRPVIVTETEVQNHIANCHRIDLTHRASARVPAAESCRTWGTDMRLRIGAVVLAFATLAALLWIAPTALFLTLTLWACLTLIVASLHKSAALIAHFIARNRAIPAPAKEKRPVVSILVPLFKEQEIAAHLVTRLSRLTYPKDLLDIVLVLEEKDAITHATLAQTTLPPWIRMVTVPAGTPQTKPRAMNYALDFCRGDIIGIYDAEDAPDPDQIDKVADRFARAPPDVVCLQGFLDYYNPRQNWLARCFTMEYATWFRVMMPGLARLGFAIPLGGTTLFFRRTALEQLGGWDAHNVTEDADLGFRLARHGYRTEMIGTTTGEEANCRLWPWVKQRSRWLKGYMVTYLVHMRDPVMLCRQMGLWKFIGMQTHFITALSQFFLAPFLWSFWLILLGLPHPLVGVVDPFWLRTAAYLFLTVEAIGLVAALIAVSGPAHRHLAFWVPSLHFYFPLGVIAAYKALYELIFAPFYWDKTQHGVSLDHQPQTSVEAFQRSGVKLQARHKRL